MNSGFYSNRPFVFSLLITLYSLILIDACPDSTLLHTNLKSMIDPVLDVTGLWQGSWTLFAPSPDHVNTRVYARVHWGDGKVTRWEQPDWYQMSALRKIRNFRVMSYYDELWHSYNSAAWDPFCEYLSDYFIAQHGQVPDKIELYVQKDVLPPPSEEWRKAYSPPQFSSEEFLYTWVKDDG